MFVNRDTEFALTASSKRASVVGQSCGKELQSLARSSDRLQLRNTVLHIPPLSHPFFTLPL